MVGGVRRTPLPSKRKLKFLVIFIRRTPPPSKRKLKFLVILLQTHQKIMLDPKENSSNFAVFLKGRDAKSQIFLAAYRPGEIFPTLSTIFDCREFFEFTVTT